MTVEEAFVQAEANAGLEGLYPSAFAKGIFEEVKKGNLSAEEAKERIVHYHLGAQLQKKVI